MGGGVRKSIKDGKLTYLLLPRGYQRPKIFRFGKTIHRHKQ
jgi:hypothetical protein